LNGTELKAMDFSEIRIQLNLASGDDWPVIGLGEKPGVDEWLMHE
jgi:hypothetical protein